MVEPQGSTFPPLAKEEFCDLISANSQHRRASLACSAGVDELYTFYRKIYVLFAGQGELRVEKIGEQISLTFGD